MENDLKLLKVEYPSIQKNGKHFHPPDTYADKIPLVLMGGWTEGQVCAEEGARTFNGASGICNQKKFKILLSTENYVLNRLCLLRIKLQGNHENFPTYIRPVQN